MFMFGQFTYNVNMNLLPLSFIAFSDSKLHWGSSHENADPDQSGSMWASLVQIVSTGCATNLHDRSASVLCCVFFFLSFFNLCSPEGFSQTYFPNGGCCNTPWIINTEGHITLNLLPVYRYGHPLSIDTKISTNH